MQNVELNLETVREHIKATTQETKIYVGADSKVFRCQKDKNLYVVYVGVIIVHYDGKHGANVYKTVLYEPYFHSIKARLLREVGIVAEISSDIIDCVGQRSMEIHLDINPDENTVSSNVVRQATGWIIGQLGITPKVKPDSFASSCVADRDAVKLGMRAKSSFNPDTYNRNKSFSVVKINDKN